MGWFDWVMGRPQAAVPAPVTAAELLRQLRSGEVPLIVDVREVGELQGQLRALPGSRNIPLSVFNRRYAEIPRDRRVVLICRSGARSGQAQTFLISQGYTQVQNVSGGMLAVQAAGYPEG